ncbi:MAG: sporulation protein SsgA [Sphingomonadaceae bacterium]|nr:sporulation protein SsgA [Sphingomonadaceae bacterium]
MRLPVSRNLPFAALVLLVVAGDPTWAKDRPAPIAINGPQSDYPMVLGQPFTVDGVTYTPADTLNYDVVGHAATAAEGGGAITASHRTLPLPSYVEITALDTGRTILVRLERRGPMSGTLLTELSPGAAVQLGIAGQARAPVRVRRVNPPEPERSALRAGRSAPARMDTPPSLRAVLMRRLEQQGPGVQVSRPGPMPTPDKLPPVPQAVPGSRAEMPPPVVVPAVAAKPVPQPVVAAAKVEPKATIASPAKAGWLVQVGAFSSKARAEAAARAIGAQVDPAGKLWRVRMVGLASQASADAALAKAKAAGYADARIQRSD